MDAEAVRADAPRPGGGDRAPAGDLRAMAGALAGAGALTDAGAIRLVEVLAYLRLFGLDGPTFTQLSPPGRRTRWSVRMTISAAISATRYEPSPWPHGGVWGHSRVTDARLARAGYQFLQCLSAVRAGAGRYRLSFRAIRLLLRSHRADLPQRFSRNALTMESPWRPSA